MINLSVMSIIICIISAICVILDDFDAAIAFVGFAIVFAIWDFHKDFQEQMKKGN